MKGDFHFNVHNFQKEAILNLRLNYILDKMTNYAFIPSTLSNTKIQSCSL